MSLIESTIKKLVDVEKRISEIKGSFILFALFKRTDILKEKNQEKWDLVMSSSWIKEKNDQANREYVFGELLKKFTGEEISEFLEKLVFIDSKDEFIKLTTNKVGELEHVHEEEKAHVGLVRDGQKLDIADAYIITSRPIKESVKKR